MVEPAPNPQPTSPVVTPPVVTPPVVTPPVTTTPDPVTEEPAKPIDFPTTAGWTFFGPQHGGPRQILDVATDANGNIWVAGGKDGLFLLKPGASKFVKFGLAEGLHPYGYNPDGTDVAGEKYLEVISVAGGPDKSGRAGVVFVGYAGKPGPTGANDCETNWDTPSTRDASIYKSGDADRVELKTDGTLHVVHYDIFSGNLIPGEPGVMINGKEYGFRERLCSIYRLAYDPYSNSVWFGGNHGFARGVANYEKNESCYPYSIETQRSGGSHPWDWTKCGVDEHTHPAINAFTTGGDQVLLSDAYRGLAVDPVSHDIWVGGTDRSTKFKYASSGNDFWTAQGMTENDGYAWNRLDFWKDAVGEPDYPVIPRDLSPDGVADLEADGDTLWVASMGRGIAHVNAAGEVTDFITSADGLLADKKSGAMHISTIAKDGATLWAGYAYLGVVAKIEGGQVTGQLWSETFGDTLSNLGISRIVVDHSTGKKRVIVGFGRPGTGTAGAALAIYEDPTP